MHPAIHHLLAIQSRHHIEIRDLVVYIETHRHNHATLLERIETSFRDIYGIKSQEQETQKKVIYQLEHLGQQVNEQVPRLIQESIQNQGFTQNWGLDVNQHIFAVETYVKEMEDQTAAQDKKIAKLNEKTTQLLEQRANFQSEQNMLESEVIYLTP